MKPCSRREWVNNKNMKNIVVKQKEGVEEMPVEIIAQEIEKISRAMQVLSTSRLYRDAIVTLIAHRSKISRRDIEIVMNNLIALERDYIKPKK